MRKTYVGFGFGAIQAGLFLLEARRGNRFDRLVAAEVMDGAVADLRRAGGRYRVNVAGEDGIEAVAVDGVEIYNPNVPADRRKLVEAVSEASEIGTALPSIDFFERGGDAAPAAVLAAGFAGRREPGVVYAAENHNHAAERLEALVTARSDSRARTPVRFLNTVIGKMSGVITDPEQIRIQQLAPVTEGGGRCFLVEAFNRILISRIDLPGFARGITVFEEKDDLLPFEEAKLYGHNATHVLLGYLAHRAGLTGMHEAAARPELMAAARAAFIDEAGPALIARHHGVDPLFSEAGFRVYAEDLLRRMVNPHLRDRVERIIRDPRRKLGWDDRLVGVMRRAAHAGITPRQFARAAALALRLLAATEKREPAGLLREIWEPSRPPREEGAAMRDLILSTMALT